MEWIKIDNEDNERKELIENFNKATQEYIQKLNEEIKIKEDLGYIAITDARLISYPKNPFGIRFVTIEEYDKIIAEAVANKLAGEV